MFTNHTYRFTDSDLHFCYALGIMVGMQNSTWYLHSTWIYRFQVVNNGSTQHLLRQLIAPLNLSGEGIGIHRYFRRFHVAEIRHIVGSFQTT